jgi:hypothetical protein
VAHGRKWKPCENILIDPVARSQPRKTTFKWPPILQLGEASCSKYFYLFYPTNTIKETLKFTNEKLQKTKKKKIDEGDFYRWLGLRLLMTYEPLEGPIRMYWETSKQPNQAHTPRDFAQYGMSRHTFENILTALSFTDESVFSVDNWRNIRPIIDGFNKRRLDVVSPGEILVVDECMSAWDGINFTFCHSALPHQTKIIRKPVSKGTEIKAIADGQTGILLGLDIMEGKEKQHLKRYHDQYGEGTAIVLRLSEPYKSSGRTVVADSAFASVKTLIQVENHLGLYFMGMVKTATKEYPMKALKEWSGTLPSRGSFKVFKSKTPKENDFYAMCWADKKPKTLISNRGTTLQGRPSVRTRHKKIIDNGIESTIRYEISVPRPEMVELFYSRFSAIDVHDHYRHGSLRLEREWLTKKWWHRIFDTVFGMVLTDAYLAYRYVETENNNSTIVDFSTFKRIVAYELIYNPYVKKRSTREANKTETGEVIEVRLFFVFN